MKRQHIIAVILFIAGFYAAWHGFWMRKASFPFSAPAKASILLPNAAQPINWPPKMGEPYPDLQLVSHTGTLVKLSDFKGKLLLIEPIGMNCPACNGFAGAKTKGGFHGLEPERDVGETEGYFRDYAKGISFDDPRIVHIHLLLFNFAMLPPMQEDAKEWADHFGITDKPNNYVLAGGKELLNQTSYDLIPGFQLVDKNFILRADSTGHHPKTGFDRVFGMVPALINE